MAEVIEAKGERKVYRVSHGDDLEVMKTLRQQTQALQLLNCDKPKEETENKLVTHFKSLFVNFVQSFVQDDVVTGGASTTAATTSNVTRRGANRASSPTNTSTTSRANAVVHRDNFKDMVEKTRKKISLNDRGLSFVSLAVKNKDERTKVKIDWFSNHGYTARELFPHVPLLLKGKKKAKVKTEDDKSPKHPPSLKEIVKAGLRASHLANDEFFDLEFFKSFVSYYEIDYEVMRTKFKVESKAKLIKLNFSVKHMLALGLKYELLVSLWNVERRDEKSFGFSDRDWKKLGKTNETSQPPATTKHKEEEEEEEERDIKSSANREMF